MDKKNGLRPVHLGEILREELDDFGLSANALSKALDVPANRITMILKGKRSVTADTTLQLWLNLQKTWELRISEIGTAHEIAEHVTPRQSAVLGSIADARP